MKNHWRRDEPQFFNIYELDSERLRDPGLLYGVEGSILSRDSRTGSATYIAQLHSGWQWTEDLEDATLEIFVLEGDLRVDGTRVGGGGYAFIPQGSSSTELTSESGALALVFWNPDMPLFPPPYTRVRVTKYWKEPWHEAPHRLVLHGTFFKSLRLPDFSGDFEGGPGGFLRFFAHMPGNNDPRQHVHHDCWEEMFILRGDIFMPERGIVGFGTCLANPQEFWHAPFTSHGGCVMITHTDGPMGPWGLREYPSGDELIEAYLDSTSWAKPQEERRWEESEWRAWEDKPEHQAWRTRREWEAWSDEVGREMASKSRARHMTSRIMERDRTE